MASSPTPADDAEETPGACPTARRILLGSLLKRLRENAGIRRAEAAYEIRGSDSKMSRLEAGKVGFKDRDVVDLLKMYGVTEGPDRDRIMEMARKSNEHGWWQRYNEVIPSWFEDFVGLEASASRIQTFELLFVPGLLQTEDYARAVLSAGRPDSGGAAAEQKLKLRLQRQRILMRPNAPTLWAVLDESVLHRPVGGPDGLTAQIDHLLEMSARSSVVLQILPWHLSGYSAEHSFTMLRFGEPELPDLVYLEEHTGASYLDKRPDVETFSRVMDRVTIDAISPEKSRRYLSSLRAAR